MWGAVTKLVVVHTIDFKSWVSQLDLFQPIKILEIFVLKYKLSFHTENFCLCHFRSFGLILA